MKVREFGGTGRKEWLIKQSVVGSISKTYRKRRGKKLFSYIPIFRFADPEAERGFKRTVRVTRDD